MKTTVGFGSSKVRFCGATIAIIFSIILLFSSCQKNESILSSFESPDGIDMISIQDLSSDCVGKNMTIFYGHKIFRRSHGSPVVESVIMENPSFNCFDGKYILKIRNGRDKRSRVSSAEIWIDGKLVVRQSDFNKNAFLIIKYISGLTPQSKLEVKLNGTPGSYIDLWIEGTMKKVKPVFDPIGPLCQGSNPPTLPLSSLNEPPVNGTWQPAVINTAIAGKATYTFTPETGQCGTKATMEIEVIEYVIPVFEPVAPIPMGTAAPLLPSISTNNITGAWIPETIDTSKPGKYTFTFTPSAGQCAGQVTIEIEITGNLTITDIDGNVYKIVKIGDQWWMAENLKVTKYSNGDLIGTTIPATLDIFGESTPKYQWAYDGNENNISTYGRLYSWYAASDNRNVCPDGWHLPSDMEWTILADYLSNNGFGYEGSGIDIGKSLSATSGWKMDLIPGNIGNDQNSNNGSGFTALPAGVRYNDNRFLFMGFYSSWWSATESTSETVWCRNFFSSSAHLMKTSDIKKGGEAIRCTKNN